MLGSCFRGCEGQAGARARLALGPRASPQRSCRPLQETPTAAGPSYLHGAGRGLMGAGDGQGGEPSASGVPEPHPHGAQDVRDPGGWADRRDVNTDR